MVTLEELETSFNNIESDFVKDVYSIYVWNKISRGEYNLYKMY